MVTKHLSVAYVAAAVLLWLVVHQTNVSAIYAQRVFSARQPSQQGAAHNGSLVLIAHPIFRAAQTREYSFCCYEDQSQTCFIGSAPPPKALRARL